jgi:hypothetical protein
VIFFSQSTPLHCSAQERQLEITCLLVESNADVAARAKCFSPPPSHHLSLTICLAAMATLLSNALSTTTDPTLLRTCAASACLKDALPCVVLLPAERECPPIFFCCRVRVAAAIWQLPLLGVGGILPSPRNYRRKLVMNSAHLTIYKKFWTLDGVTAL